MAALKVGLLLPGAAQLSGDAAGRTAGVVVAIMLCAYFVGTQHPRLLT